MYRILPLHDCFVYNPMDYVQNITVSWCRLYNPTDYVQNIQNVHYENLRLFN